MVLAPIGACKYETSCSKYTMNMVSEFGVIKGLLLGVRRILSCR